MFDFLIRILFDNAGGSVVLPDNCILPPRCAICNKQVVGPAQRLRLKCTAVGADPGRITIRIYLCGWHAIRRKLILLVSSVAALVCGIVVSGRDDGQKPSTGEFVAFIGLIISSLLFINALLNNVYFRGLDWEAGGMAIKGFGKRFRKSLRPEEIVVSVEPTEH
jgi:hypothetical protein